MRVEELAGLRGTFTGEVMSHPNPRFVARAVAVGTITYQRTMCGESKDKTVPVQGVAVKRLQGNDDDYDHRRYIRIIRGPRGFQDKIIALVDN